MCIRDRYKALEKSLDVCTPGNICKVLKTSGSIKAGAELISLKSKDIWLLSMALSNFCLSAVTIISDVSITSWSRKIVNRIDPESLIVISF